MNKDGDFEEAPSKPSVPDGDEILVAVWRRIRYRCFCAGYSESEVDEISQEAALRLKRWPGSLRSKGGGWELKLERQCAGALKRKRPGFVPLPSEPASEVESVGRFTREEVSRALASLPRRDQEILFAVDVDRFSIASAASIFNLTVPAMHKAIQRARQALLERLIRMSR